MIDEYKVSRKATAQKKILVGILRREYKEKLRKAIIGKLTKYSQKKRNKDQQKVLNAKPTISANRKTSKKNSQTHRKLY